MPASTDFPTEPFPKAPRRGFILWHNHIIHYKNTRVGRNGFRAYWSKTKGENQAVCHCGWAPDAGRHYAGKDTAAWWLKIAKGDPETTRKLAAIRKQIRDEEYEARYGKPAPGRKRKAA